MKKIYLLLLTFVFNLNSANAAELVVGVGSLTSVVLVGEFIEIEACRSELRSPNKPRDSLYVPPREFPPSTTITPYHDAFRKCKLLDDEINAEAVAQEMLETEYELNSRDQENELTLINGF
jgi:hypothetical protein